MKFLHLTVCVLALSACATDLETSSTTSEARVYLGGGDGSGDPCPSTGCGTNSPFLSQTEFHELEETGALANQEGFKLVSFILGGKAYKPDVVGSVLVARAAGMVNVTGPALVGGQFLVQNARSNEGFIITITRVSRAQTFWQGTPTYALPAPLDKIESYELKWRPFPTPRGWDGDKAVCNNPPDRLDPDYLQYADVSEAILFTGDRYDRSNLTVTATTKDTSGNWFNIACAGNVLSKLFLNRHTDASQTPGAPTTLEQRQAMLKMYTSDLCNTGQAFTKQGTPLRWQNPSGTLHNAAPAYLNREALWTSTGALCLDTHRLHGSLDDMAGQYSVACPMLVPCTDAMVAGPGWYLKTSSPAR